jgi:hypothetical protein
MQVIHTLFPNLDKNPAAIQTRSSNGGKKTRDDFVLISDQIVMARFSLYYVGYLMRRRKCSELRGGRDAASASIL